MDLLLDKFFYWDSIKSPPFHSITIVRQINTRGPSQRITPHFTKIPAGRKLSFIQKGALTLYGLKAICQAKISAGIKFDRKWSCSIEKTLEKALSNKIG